LEDPEPDELEAWLDRLGVKGLSRRLCLEASDHAGFYPFNREIFLVVPFLKDKETPRKVDHLALFCRERRLLTFHGGAFLTEERLDDLRESQELIPQPSIAGLVSTVLLDLSMNCVQHTTNLRNEILALEDRMDRAPDTVEVDEILDIRSELLTVERSVSGQLPTLRSLSTTDKPFFRLKDTQEYVNCALVNLKTADRTVDRQEKRIVALRSGFQMHAQDKTNQRLGMLTVLSAIFMPITLLAGIWGMNFETMPELKFAFGYPAALGLMALVAAGMYLYFRRHGWFG
jgi:magnesium/cobalt transport protein CorA